MFSLCLHHFLTLSTLWTEMGIVEKEGGLPVFDTDNLKFFCQMLKLLPGSSVKSAQIYPPQSDGGVKDRWESGVLGKEKSVSE